MTRSRILIVIRNLLPLVDGMERLNCHMADELSRNAEVRVIGPSGAAALKPTSVELNEAPLKPLPLFLVVALFKALWIALRWRPNVVLAGSGLTAPLAWVASKVCGARTVAYLHGFDVTHRQRAVPLHAVSHDATGKRNLFPSHSEVAGGGHPVRRLVSRPHFGVDSNRETGRCPAKILAVWFDCCAAVTSMKSSVPPLLRLPGSEWVRLRKNGRQNGRSLKSIARAEPGWLPGFPDLHDAVPHMWKWKPHRRTRSRNLPQAGKQSR